MNYPKKLVLLSSLFATFGLMGCTTDSDSDSCDLNEEMCQSTNKTFDAENCLCVDYNSQSCPITQAMCESANKTLDANKCECVDTGTPGSQSCHVGEHLNGNSCEEDSVQNCGQHGYDCTSMIQGWAAGGCLNGACEATACAKDFHTYNHTCEADSLQNCGSHDNTCSTSVDGWKSGTCTDGSCVASECVADYHLSTDTDLSLF